MEKYIQNPDWEFEKVPSVACGPMVKWARAQLLYSTMLHKVEPLRNELKRLEKEAAKKTEEGKVVDVKITELEESIGKYKEEYAQLIGQAENIKQDLSSVQEKVNRPTQLLSSLRPERDRWSSGSAGFSQQMDSLVGDALLSSAFLAYAEYYDQMIRDEIFQKWFNHVVNAGLHFRHDLARIEYLSTVDDRLQWQLNSLPVDDLCTENAIMLHRFKRYPLIIDRSGQAVEYIMKQPERPDVDKKRNDLLKLQGEFAVRLRHLEKALLAALNESKVKILDDNSVIETLERLKNEAAEVDAVSAQYQRLATACSHVYHTLQQLNEIHFLYHYSLNFLVEIFTYVLKTPELSSTIDYAKRLRIITTSLFKTVFRRVSRGMLHTDKVLLALLLMRIHIRSNPAAPAYEQHFDLLLGRSDVVTKTVESESVIPSGLDFLSMDNKKAISKTAKLNGFENVFAQLKSNAAAVTSWLTHDNPESNVPVIWEDTDNKLTPLCIAMNSMIVVHALRPDRLMASAHRVVCTAFDDHFMQQDKVVDILSIVDNEVAPSEPVLLRSATGYDASGKIEDLAVETSRQLTSIAIGSAEGFIQADSALAAATKSDDGSFSRTFIWLPAGLPNWRKDFIR
ncbi:hypothetical protein B9Z55_002922 [Caenorhabditis nigoni]|uniref:Dynein heavy chain coiled coil stalk domain-containing protein n=1 Tax=Caenorhabditis nigoni TaxID=1611254 RepID=A0A2G5VN37_9PELO|nr:hypothetical protein B9Z55_002922 [Caenorhabditis nigoni]